MKDKARILGIYARVSTHNGQHPETQLLPMREFCQHRQLRFTEYVDEGVSGAKARRPALDRLMADARQGLLSTVLVWRFDRFARSTSHLHQALDEFKQLGVQFISLTENVDTATPAGKLMFTVLGAVAEMEREIIRERVKAGLVRAKRAGKTIGGWRAKRLDGKPRGYRKPLPPNPELLAQVHRLHKKNLSLRSIAEEVKRSHTLVAKLLKIK
jgi:DNA invertase Pin-like site-specific DNA recombinase